MLGANADEDGCGVPNKRDLNTLSLLWSEPAEIVWSLRYVPLSFRTSQAPGECILEGASVTTESAAQVILRMNLTIEESGESHSAEEAKISEHSKESFPDTKTDLIGV